MQSFKTIGTKLLEEFLTNGRTVGWGNGRTNGRKLARLCRHTKAGATMILD